MGALDASRGVEPVDLPAYAHLPMLVNEQRKKLSKRRDPVAVEHYRDQGYLPEALRQLPGAARLEPARRPREVATRDELVEQFDIEDVSHSPAFFDVKKLTHINGEYVRALGAERVRRALRAVGRAGGSAWRPTGDGPPWAGERVRRGGCSRESRPSSRPAWPRSTRSRRMVAFFFERELAVDDAAFDKAVTDSAHGRDILGRRARGAQRLGPTGRPPRCTTPSSRSPRRHGPRCARPRPRCASR